ncbi:MAG: hypothetical protein AMXMBFR7_26900 [Planctomycetota bacterium]
MAWSTPEKRRQRALEYTALGFAALGIVVLGVVVLGGHAAPQRQTPAEPSVALVPSAPPIPMPALPAGPSLLQVAGHPESAGPLPPGGTIVPLRGTDPSTEAQPPATRGTASIVRWRGPLAQGLLLLDQARAGDALAWAQQHDAHLGAAGRLIQARALLDLRRLNDARLAFAAAQRDAQDAGTRSDAQFGLALCAAGGQPELIASDALAVLAADASASWGMARAALAYAQAVEDGHATVNAPGGTDPKPYAEELARAYYQKAFLAQTLERSHEDLCRQRLEALTERIVLNPGRAHLTEQPRATMHAVEPGQSLYAIAKRYGVSIGALARLNRLERNAFLRVGQTLKVLPGRVSLHVDRWRLTATLLVDGAYLKQWPVGIGPDEKTPSGAFSVRTKLVNPDWYYGGQRIPFGHPENILGTRWLGFDRDEHGGKGAGIGVHGTAIPESVPGRESKGCVRMRNAEVEELYDWLPQGGLVVIP